MAYGVRHFNTVLRFFGVQAHPCLERITILKFRSQPTFQWQMLLVRDMRLMFTELDWLLFEITLKDLEIDFKLSKIVW